MTTTPAYISTVVPAGYARYAVRLGGALLCVVDRCQEILPAYADRMGTARVFINGVEVGTAETRLDEHGVLVVSEFDALPEGAPHPFVAGDMPPMSWSFVPDPLAEPLSFSRGWSSSFTVDVSDEQLDLVRRIADEIERYA